MSLDACFLSIDEDKPLAIFWADDRGCGVIDLETFIADSCNGMSVEMAIKYAERFQRFADDLMEYVSRAQQ